MKLSLTPHKVIIKNLYLKGLKIFKGKIMIKTIVMTMVACCCLQAHAQVVAIDDKWLAFDIDEAVSLSGGGEWIDLDGNALRYEIDLERSALLKVVDAGFAGDRFEVFDKGALLVSTSVAVNTYPTSVGIDFDAAFDDSRYSRGMILLPAGSHTITGLLSTSALDDNGIPLNATVGAISLTAVPVPAAAGLYLAGSALLGWAARPRKVNG
jgi:hypothetical protein